MGTPLVKQSSRASIVQNNCKPAIYFMLMNHVLGIMYYVGEKDSCTTRNPGLEPSLSLRSHALPTSPLDPTYSKRLYSST